MNQITKSSIKLSDGNEIPQLGLGTFLSRGKTCEQSVDFALKNGYDHIDTAQGYDNEKQVGNGWKSSGRNRDDIFITTKISTSNQGYDSAKTSFKQSLKDLRTDYVDLLLIHWPNIENFNKSIETWRALVDMQKDGLCRSIGVSNFTEELIAKLLGEFDIVPAINQVEFHTFLYQKELLDYCRGKNIQLEAYSPIAKAQLFDHKVLKKMAKKYQKSAAQIMLAWCINHDIVVIPKSVNEPRIIENSEIFFKIKEEDMAELNQIEPQTRLVDGGIWTPPTW